MKRLGIIIFVLFLLFFALKHKRIKTYSELRTSQFNTSYEEIVRDYFISLTREEEFGKNNTEIEDFLENEIGSLIDFENNILFKNGFHKFTDSPTYVEFLCINGHDGKPSKKKVLMEYDSKGELRYPKLNLFEILFSDFDLIITYKITPEGVNIGNESDVLLE